MVYICALWSDGACRNNGGHNRDRPVFGGYGVFYPRGKAELRRRYGALMPATLKAGNQTATSNRAELYGLIMALKTARQVQEDLWGRPLFLTYIRMDSKYVQMAMTEWRFKWQNNGWRTAKGDPVANQDLFNIAIDLLEEVEAARGKVKILHIPRDENEPADELANDGCDLAEEQYNARRRRFGMF